MLYTCVKEVMKTGRMTWILKYMQSGGKPDPRLDCPEHVNFALGQVNMECWWAAGISEISLG